MSEGLEVGQVERLEKGITNPGQQVQRPMGFPGQRDIRIVLSILSFVPPSLSVSTCLSCSVDQSFVLALAHWLLRKTEIFNVILTEYSWGFFPVSLNQKN